MRMCMRCAATQEGQDVFVVRDTPSSSSRRGLISGGGGISFKSSQKRRRRLQDGTDFTDSIDAQLVVDGGLASCALSQEPVVSGS